MEESDDSEAKIVNIEDILEISDKMNKTSDGEKDQSSGEVNKPVDIFEKLKKVNKRPLAASDSLHGAVEVVEKTAKIHTQPQELSASKNKLMNDNKSNADDIFEKVANLSHVRRPSEEKLVLYSGGEAFEKTAKLNSQSHQDNKIMDNKSKGDKIFEKVANLNHVRLSKKNISEYDQILKLSSRGGNLDNDGVVKDTNVVDKLNSVSYETSKKQPKDILESLISIKGSKSKFSDDEDKTSDNADYDDQTLEDSQSALNSKDNKQ